MTKIAFLGLGAMGRRMVEHLVKADMDVSVWNRSPVAPIDRAAFAASPAEAARDADIVLTMLTDDAAAQTVWLGAEGALSTMRPGALAVEMSTVSTTWIDHLAQETEARGVGLLDAPVAGSRPQAEAGELVFLIGGTAENVDRFRPLAEAMGKAVLHAGDQGKGIVLKLMVNGLLAIQTAALSELLGFGIRGGIDPNRAVELLSPVPVTSPAAAFVARQIAEKAHDPMFTVDLMEKDLGYLVGGADMPLMEETRARFGAASAKGHGGKHITAVAL